MRGVVVANVLGAVIATVLAAFLYGETIEEELFPVLSTTEVSRVVRAGTVLNWHQEWCKLRNLEVVSTSYTFSYPKQKTATPINVQNLTLGLPVGTTTMPAGCYAADYSAILPKDAVNGGAIKSQLWYNPGHPFWDVREDFAEIEVPPLDVMPGPVLPSVGLGTGRRP